ncbi:MAG: cobalamin-binding protein [Xanthomonadales bacterium]|nr:cobalamin-binding protein [Xanthomonadales bacterium]
MIEVAGRTTGLPARVFAALALVWCSATAGPAGDEPPASPRIVSLAPHLTELAFDAGIGDMLVGVVEWSDYPAAAASLPRVGDAFRFDLEKILRLETTHALAWGGGTPPGAIAELEALGVAVEIVEIEGLEEIGSAIERLGVLGGSPVTAEATAASFRERLADFRARRESTRRAVSIFYQVSERPLFTLGAKHVINEVFALCGGVNLFDELNSEAASVDLEAVLARDPLAIVIGGDRQAAVETHWASYPNLRAVACDNILQVDPALLVRPTPRILDGAGKLCTWLDEEVMHAENPACRIDRD